MNQQRHNDYAQARNHNRNSLFHGLCAVTEMVIAVWLYGDTFDPGLSFTYVTILIVVCLGLTGAALIQMWHAGRYMTLARMYIRWLHFYDTPIPAEWKEGTRDVT